MELREAYVLMKLMGGGSAPVLQSKSATPSLTAQNITPDDGYDGLSSVSVGAVTGTLLSSLDADFVAENIKEDVNLFGVVGTFAGGGGLEIEQGTVVFEEDIAHPEIAFTNVHNTVPDIIVFAGKEGESYVANSALSFTLIMDPQFMIDGAKANNQSYYGLTWGNYRSNTSGGTSSYSQALLQYAWDYSGYSQYPAIVPKNYVTPTGFKPTPYYTGSYAWRAGATYTWIAIWGLYELPSA